MGFTFLAFAELDVKDYKPGDVKRPLLREMLVWMISEKELKPGGADWRWIMAGK